MEKSKGLRFNEGKLRYDLLHPVAQKGIVKVLTKGAEKYEPHNWEKGMEWSKVIASMKRHLAAFESGEDYDPETGELHADHLQCNAHFLSAYYKIAPQYDDRQHTYLKNLKIGLDIDEVLVDWIGGYKEFYKYDESHEFGSWYLHFDILGRCKDDLDDEFYKNLKPKVNPNDIPFLPHCYITSRNIDTKITEDWLYNNGFPCRPVRTVGLSESKVDVAKEMGVDIFVDDVYKNFLDLNNNGVMCYLMDAPHNRRYDVGHKRIKSLSELK